MAGADDHIVGLVRAGDPVRHLATLYAPAAVRPALYAIHALDLALLDVAVTTTDPMVGHIRLAWWRERIAELGHGKAPAEPILLALAHSAVTAASLDGFDDPSLAFLDGAMIDWAVQRGERLFSAVSLTLSVPVTSDTLAAGRGWGAVDGWRRGFVEKDEVQPILNGAPSRSPGPLRPLMGLLAVARSDFQRADPGQPDGVAVSPSRQLRLAFAIVSGRL